MVAQVLIADADYAYSDTPVTTITSYYPSAHLWDLILDEDLRANDDWILACDTPTGVLVKPLGDGYLAGGGNDCLIRATLAAPGGTTDNVALLTLKEDIIPGDAARRAA